MRKITKVANFCHGATKKDENNDFDENYTDLLSWKEARLTLKRARTETTNLTKTMNMSTV